MYEAPRELIGAAGANLTEMPRHAERSFCCGAGGARMWMEEHIGKRINHERVDEALATNAATIATACPFCRVMVTDGVNDRQEEAGRSGVEVLDVAQVLLGSLEYDKATLPAKGTAAKEAEKRAATAPKAAASAAPAAPPKAEEPAPTKAAEPEPAAKASAPTAPTVPSKGLGIAGGAKRPGAKKAAAPTAPAPAAKATEAPAEAAAPAAPAAPAKGLGLAAGASAAGAAFAAPAAPVKGLGIAAGAKRPGAKKAVPAAKGAEVPTQQPEAAAEPEQKAQPAEQTDGDAAPPAAPAAPVKGLGIARGARPPGKR